MNVLMMLEIMVPIETLQTLVAIKRSVLSGARPTMAAVGQMLRGDDMSIFELRLQRANKWQAAAGFMQISTHSVNHGWQRG